MELIGVYFSVSFLYFSVVLYSCVCPNRIALNRKTNPSKRMSMFMASCGSLVCVCVSVLYAEF